MCIIMVGKQMFNNFIEFLLPRLSVWWRRWGSRKKNSVENDGSEEDVESRRGDAVEDEAGRRDGANSSVATPTGKKRWESDFALEEIGELGLFNEYLEMVSHRPISILRTSCCSRYPGND